MHITLLDHYNETCLLRPQLGPEKAVLICSGLYKRSIWYMIRAVCSEKGGLKIQVVFLNSGHIIQVSLYNIFKCSLNHYQRRSEFMLNDRKSKMLTAEQFRINFGTCLFSQSLHISLSFVCTTSQSINQYFLH